MHICGCHNILDCFERNRFWENSWLTKRSVDFIKWTVFDYFFNHKVVGKRFECRNFAAGSFGFESVVQKRKVAAY